MRWPVQQHQRTVTGHGEPFESLWGERKRWVKCGGAGRADVGRRGDTRSGLRGGKGRGRGGSHGIFVSLVTSIVIRDQEVALESEESSGYCPLGVSGGREGRPETIELGPTLDPNQHK